MMVEGCGSSVSLVGMVRAVGTVVGRTVRRHSAGPSVGVSRGAASLAPAVGLVASSSG